VEKSAPSQLPWLGDEARRLADLYRLSVDLAAARGEAQVVAVILREAHQTLGAQVASLWLIDGARLVLQLPEESSPAARAINPVPLDAAFPLAEVARTGEPRFWDSAERLLAEAPLVAETVRDTPAGAWAVLPLVGSGGVVGAIPLAFPDRHPIEPAERHFLLGFASHAAHAIERARLHGQLERGTERLRAIIGQMRDGVSVIDASGQVVFVNDAAARMSGFPDAESMLDATRRNTVLSRFALRDDAGNPIGADDLPNRQVARGAVSAQLVIWYHNLDSREERCSHVSAFPVRAADGSIEQIVSVFRDITDERRAADALRFLDEASQKLSESLDYEATLKQVAKLAVPRLADWCSVEMVRPDGKTEQLAVEHVDPAKIAFAREMATRYPPDPNAPSGVPNVIRTGKPELYHHIPDEMLERAARSAEHRELIFALGLRSALVVPIRHRGPVMGAISFVSAESSRRYTEADLTFAMELARRAAVAIENARLYAEARAAIQLRDDFLSVAGHELRTPLTALQLQLDRVQRQAQRGGLEPKDLQQQLDRALGQLGRIGRLVGDLLDVARLNAGRLALDVVQTDLSSLVKEVADRFADQTSKAGSTLRVDVPAECTGEWDRTRLDQVLTNLVSNAIKYGGGKPIDLALHDAGARVEVTVTDHGIGVGPADRERIFERFERAVSDRHYGGLGLGLWISREIVRAHGGTIEVVSKPGIESTFTVALPRQVPKP
jgi:signal transduction histidine kinase/PAS domain-containing protein